jgi:phage terminase Nu1 subunit (DNA packaging protein)
MARRPIQPDDDVSGEGAKGVVTEVDEATLGRVLDCDAQEIRRYWRMGIIKRTPAKTYPLFPSIRFVVGHFRRLASGYGTGEAMRANAALRDSQRRLTDLRYDQLRGALVSMTEIEAMWGDLIQATQFLFRSIASRMRDRAPDLSREHYELLQQLTQELLREVAIAGKAPLLPASPPSDNGKHADAENG